MSISKTIGCLAALVAASRLIAPVVASTSPDLLNRDLSLEEHVCAIPAFTWHANSGASYCCPGVLEGADDNYYCCVGGSVPANTAVTTTQTSCATTVQVTDRGYTSKVAAAATKYAVTYTTNTGLPGTTEIATETLGRDGRGLGSTTSSAGAAAVVTRGCGLMAAAGAVAMAL